MCSLLINSAVFADSTLIFYTPITDPRWTKLKSIGEEVLWDSHYEEQYKGLMHKLLIANVGIESGNSVSNSTIISRLCTLASMAALNTDKEKGRAKAEKFLIKPTVEQARAVIF
jgi:hypothetical protein